MSSADSQELRIGLVFQNKFHLLSKKKKDSTTSWDFNAFAVNICEIWSMFTVDPPGIHVLKKLRSHMVSLFTWTSGEGKHDGGSARSCFLFSIYWQSLLLQKCGFYCLQYTVPYPFSEDTAVSQLMERFCLWVKQFLYFYPPKSLYTTNNGRVHLKTCKKTVCLTSYQSED